MTGYYAARRFVDAAEARRYLAEREAERAIEARRAEDALNHSRAWLAKYRSQPRPTSFDWRPKLGAFEPTLQETTSG